MASENDRMLQEFGARLADLGQALSDGVDVGDLDEVIDAITSAKPVGGLLKGPHAAKAWYQVTVGIMQDVAEDNLSVPDGV
jgi:hypothetical protein